MALRVFDRNVNGQRTPCDVINSRLLAASTAENIPVPTGAKTVSFNSDAVIGVNFYGTATITADVTNGSASELLHPAAPLCDRTFRIPTGVTNISVITEASGGAKVSASFYL